MLPHHSETPAIMSKILKNHLLHLDKTPTSIDMPLELRARQAQRRLFFACLVLSSALISGCTEPPVEICGKKIPVDATTLDCHGDEASNLSGAEQLKSLRSVHLTDSDVRDLSPLSELSRITRIIAGGSDVRDLNPLSNLTLLEELDLGQTDVVDLAPLAGMTRLKMLTLECVAVSDITPLAGLKALEQLSLEMTLVENIDALTELENLRHLDLRGINLSAGDRARLRRALPEAEIRWEYNPGEATCGRRPGG